MSSKKPIYELRIYTIIPKYYPDLLKLWEKDGKIIISKYMNCIGIWSSEFGELNKIFHLYKWNNHSERNESRSKFYKDPSAKKYVKKVKNFYQKQESYMLSSLDKLF